MSTLKEALYVDKVLFPLRKGRIILYSATAIGMIIAFVGLFMDNDYSLLLVSLGLVIVIISCCKWMSRATNYILGKRED